MKPVTLAPGIGDDAPTAALYYGSERDIFDLFGG